MGSSFRAKRALTNGSAQPQNKRLKTAPNEEGSSTSEVDMLQMLPPELLLLVIGNLTPRECQPLRLTCKALRDVVNASAADTLTVTNDIAQYLLLEQIKHSHSGAHAMSNGWVARLLAKFPRIKKLDVKCTQNVLTIFARHMVRDCLGSTPTGSVPLTRIFDLAENVKTNSRRHSAVLLCELIKFKVAQSLTSKPQGYDAMRQDIKHFNRADALLAEHRMELQARVIELVEKVLTLKGHVEARAHENYKYARDTLDDSLLQLVSCLQPRHSKYAYQLLAKAADPAKAARGWRWLFYFLARQKQAEAAIEAYKVVDKQALASLSPTCLSELFRSLIDNEITTQPEMKLRAITSESGSWTKFLYRGAFTLSSAQSREGALEKVAADLIGKDYLDTAVNVMNRFETESTAMELWVQLLGALGIVPGGEMPLVARNLHSTITDQVTKATQLAMQVLPARRVACHVPLVEVLVAEGHLEEAYQLVANYPEQGALDKHLLRALANAFSLVECRPEQLSAATCDVLLDVLQNCLRDVAARSELTTILVAAYAARKQLDKAVQLACSLDAAAAAAMDVDAAAAAAAAEPVPAAAAAAAGAGPAAGHDPVGDAAALGDGDGTGLAAVANERLKEMWRGVATAAIRQGDAGVVLTALPRVDITWLLDPVDASWGPEEVAAPRGAQAGSAATGGSAGPSGAGGGGGCSAAQKAQAAGQSGCAAEVATSAPNAADNGGTGEADSGDGPTPLPVAPQQPDRPATVWQRACGVLLRAGRRDELESLLNRILAEQRRSLAGPRTQRALLESTARAMLVHGHASEALALARRLGGGYTSVPGGGCCSVAAPSGDAGDVGSEPDSPQTKVQPCWSMLNVILEGYLAAGQLNAVLQELLAAGAAQSKASSRGVSSAAPEAKASSPLLSPGTVGHLRQALLTDVLSALTDAGRPAEAVHLLRVLRDSENDDPLLPPPVPLRTVAVAAVQRTGIGRAARTGRASVASKRNRGNSALAAAAAAGAFVATEEGADAALALVEAALAEAPGGTASAAAEQASGAIGSQATTAGTESEHYPRARYNKLQLEDGGEAADGRSTAAGSRPQAGSTSSSFEAVLTALVKALQKRSSGNGGGSATASGSSAGAAGSGGSPPGVDLLADWLEVCKAWPPGPGRDAQLDALARRSMDKGRDLDVALQAGWLLAEALPQELRQAYTHRDMAQKCIAQGMLEAAQACLMRIWPKHWDAGDATARELMRAMARAGDKRTALQLATAWIPSEDQRADFVKALRSIRPSAGANGTGTGGGSRAGSSSRGSSRD